MKIGDIIVFKGTPKKCMFNSANFKIYSVEVDEVLNGVIIKHPVYGSVSIKGDFQELILNSQYEIEVEYGGESKYGHDYLVVRCTQPKPTTKEQVQAFLSEFISPKRAENIVEAYPNIIDLVLEDKPIDTSKIKGVGEATIKSIIDKITQNIGCLEMHKEYGKYGFSLSMLSKIVAEYRTVENAKYHINRNPYVALTNINGLGFIKADEIALKINPKFLNSLERMVACINYYLSENESSGNTYMKLETLHSECLTHIKESIGYFKVAIEDESIYYEPMTNRVARQRTRDKEDFIAKKLIEMDRKAKKWKVNIDEFKEIGEGITLTDEQISILSSLASRGVSCLTGYAGCVDKDTEYFNGKEWKKICDYAEGEKVLQYDIYSNEATLVYPKSYIKNKQTNMNYIEFVDGSSQVLSDNHNVIFLSDNGKIKVDTMSSIKEKISQGNFYGEIPNYFEIKNGDIIDLTHFLDTYDLINSSVCETDSGFQIFLNGDREISESKISQYTTKDGYEYCFEVETGALILRREDKIFITGNCGKSQSIASCVAMLKSLGKTYKLATPTAKSADVLADFTRENVKTIHRTLGYNGSSFSFNAKCKLDIDVLILDEFSMVDINLFYALMCAIDTSKTRILLVGDPSQLPSIGAGNILHDLSTSDTVGYVELTRVFRYGDGGLMKIATDIRNGMKFLDNTFTGHKVFGNNKDFCYVEIDQDFMVDKAINFYMKLLENGNTIENISIITNKNVSKFGTIEINRKIQEVLQKDSDNDFIQVNDGLRIYVGDKVRQTVNNYEIPIVSRDKSEEIFSLFENDETPIFDEDCEEEQDNSKNAFIGEVYNGQTGIVTFIDSVNKKIHVRIKGIEYEYSKDEISKQLTLGYCITITSSQGMSIDNVITLLPRADTFMVTSNSLYTAVTRARKRCYLLGNINTVNGGIRKKANLIRHTFTKELLHEYHNK